MSNKNLPFYVIIHGHFYQPPRENPWTEQLERQKEAEPYHDWNELISYQCYLPNGCARVVDNKGKIVDIVNNYSYINFNFGPTLFYWLEKNFPQVVDFIVEADRESAIKNKGHGNAIAQAYSHMILPLANERDKYTQVRWGIRFFEKKFGHYPEAIWLPETAINYSTVRVLIDCNMKFVILSPLQAARVKPLGKDENSWIDVSNGNINTTLPYRLFYKDEEGKKLKDRFIDVFFYNADLSRAIAFEKLLKSSQTCASRIEQVIKNKEEVGLLVNIATDGETYGHHEPFSEMCLAHLVKYELPKWGARILNYAYYLENHLPMYEVEIKEGKNGEGTSWSCIHGVGRWKEDCGCNTGIHPEWNQKWRAPLRKSLDWLRDRLIEVFEKEGGIFRDPWQARDNYIELILDRSPENVDRFLKEHLKVDLSPENRIKALKLLEMQRFSMLMYTSCGWFFDDLSGPETVQNLKYAARAMQLAGEIIGQDLEVEFLNHLQEAKSNLQEYRDGRDVYEKLVRPSTATWQKIFAHFLISRELLEEAPLSTSLYHFELQEIEEREISGSWLKLGRGKLTFKITQEAQEGVFFIAYFGENRIYCFVTEPLFNNEDYLNLKRKILSEEIDLNLEGLKNLVSPVFDSPFTLKDLFPEERERILTNIMKERAKEIREFTEMLFEKNVDLVHDFVQMGWRIKPDFSFLMSNVLTSRISSYVTKFEQDENFDHFDRVEQVEKMASKLGLKLNTRVIEKVAERFVLKKIDELTVQFKPGLVDDLLEMHRRMKRMNIYYRKYEAQNKLWEIIQEKVIPQLERILTEEEETKFLTGLLNLAEKLDFNMDSLREKSKIQRQNDIEN